jgi:hypothetical protein
MRPIILRQIVAACCTLFVALMLLPPSARSADHYILESGLPVQVTDTIPIRYRNTEVQGYFRWEHTREGEEEFRLVPRLEYGIFPNAQIEIEAPFEFGEAVDRNEFKRVGVELFYNVNQEGLTFPALAVAGGTEFPVGSEIDGVDPTVKLIVSKTLGRSALWHRVHFNAAWTRNNERNEDERRDLYTFIVGYDRRLNPDTILILDFVRQQERERNIDINLLEAGLRYQLTPLTVVAAGVGAGVGEDSPDLRVTVGFQHSFEGWYFR